MLNLKELKSLQSQSQALGQRRHARAEACFQTGMDQLALAHEQGFRDPQPGQQACLAFIEAIRHHRSDQRPYLMLAYLFAIFRDFRTASQYLKGAHDVAPGHPDVLRFRQAIQAMQLRALERPAEADSQDLEAELTALLHELARQPVPAASPEPARIEALSERSRAFHARQQSLLQRVAALGASEDTGSLDKLLQRLQSLWHPYDAALLDSRRLADIQARIRQSQQRVPGLIRQSHSGEAAVTELESALEALLDQCDACADALDALEQRQVPIHEVEPDYAQLVRLIETLQESLDEADA